MTSTEQRAKSDVRFRFWLSYVAEYLQPLGLRLSEAQQWYSFAHAFDEAMSPRAAAIDCKEWLLNGMEGWKQ